MFPEKLLKGYQNFLKTRFEAERQRYETLAEGAQSPEVMVIGCCDSRVSPEVIFDAKPGELFVVRNVANLVPPHEVGGAFHGTSAALEFAVEVLNVKHIVVLGHHRCGGIRAYAEKMAPLTSGDFIGKWINMIAPAADMIGGCNGASMDDYAGKLELASIGQSLVNLMTFGMVRRRVEAGTLYLHGAYFGISDGRLLLCDATSRAFKPLAA
jgi:carbonic anhydrase